MVCNNIYMQFSKETDDTFFTVGTVIACKLNAPGSWHDSQVAQPIYKKLHTTTLEGNYLVTDTAFPRGTNQIEGHI